MYCIHCGAEQAANYCRKCGKSQTVATSDASQVHDAQVIQTSQCIDRDDWVKHLDYHQLLRCEEPRRRIAAASSKSKPGVTGDDVLALFEAVSPTKLSISKLTHAIVPIVDKQRLDGVHTLVAKLPALD